MITRIRYIIPLLIFVLSISACSQNPGPRAQSGALIGAALGGLLGSALSDGSAGGTLSGVLIGGVIGSAIGERLDEADRKAMQEALSTARNSEIGRTIEWNNRKSGNYGYVTPLKDGMDKQGHYCREIEQSVTIQGETYYEKNIACLDESGRWQIIS